MSARGLSFTANTFQPITLSSTFDLSKLKTTPLKPAATTPDLLELVANSAKDDTFVFSPGVSVSAEADDGFATASSYGFVSASSSAGGSSVSVHSSSYAQSTDNGSFAFAQANVFDGTSTYSVSDFDSFWL